MKLSVYVATLKIALWNESGATMVKVTVTKDGKMITINYFS